jgi:dihydroxyacetone kinase-like protein
MLVHRMEQGLLAAGAMITTAHAPALDVTDARGYLRRCSAIVRRHADALTRLDAALGDGDHGDNLLAGLAAIEGALDHADDDLPGLLRSVGATLAASVGGASGPLYGSALMEAGFAARAIDGADRIASLSILLDAAAEGLARRGHCGIGDKTIYDTLAPAADALREAVRAGDDERTAMRRMVIAAARGMRSTTPLVARRGLAMRLGERSRGHRDPGAASCLLLLLAIAPKDRGGR